MSVFNILAESGQAIDVNTAAGGLLGVVVTKLVDVFLSERNRRLESLETKTTGFEIEIGRLRERIAYLQAPNPTSAASATTASIVPPAAGEAHPDTERVKAVLKDLGK